MHSFTRGLDLDIQAATAAVTMPHHNGRTGGVSFRTKMIKGSCTAAPDSSSSGTGSCSDEITIRHHRKYDRPICGTDPMDPNTMRCVLKY
jgi:hypothetical protein